MNPSFFVRPSLVARRYKSSGNREFVPNLARAAVASGVDGLFFEVHDNPEEALSDGPNMLYLDNFEALLRDLVAIDKIVKVRGGICDYFRTKQHRYFMRKHAIEELSSRLDHNFVNAVNMILACKGRVVCTGMGKSVILVAKLRLPWLVLVHRHFHASW